MALSFLIVNRNGGEVFKKCIESIQSNCQEISLMDYEIIVVDNASDDDISWLKKIPKLKLIKNKENEFFSKPTNDSVTHSKGELLFILNNDVILEKNCLEYLLDEIKKEDIDAVVPQLQYPNGTIQQSITGIPTWKDILWSAFGLHLFAPKKDKWRLRSYDYSKKHVVTDQPMFSALMLKRKVWDSVGGLDVDLPLLWNDVEWFWRFHQKKYRCLFLPEAKATHVHGMSVNKLIWRKLYLLSQGCYVFLMKTANKPSFLFKLGMLLLCTFTFFERIPVELYQRIKQHSIHS